MDTVTIVGIAALGVYLVLILVAVLGGEFSGLGLFLGYAIVAITGGATIWYIFTYDVYMPLIPGLLIVAVAVFTGYKAFTSLMSVYADLLRAPVYALRTLGSGARLVITFPYVLIRGIIYFFNKPPALRDIRNATQRQDATMDDVQRASEALKKEFDETHKSTPRQKPSVVVDAYGYHYRRFADYLSARRARVMSRYNRSVSHVANELRKDTERRYRHAQGETHEEQR